MTDKEMLDAIKKMLSGDSETAPPQKPQIKTDSVIQITAADLLEFAKSMQPPEKPSGDDEDGDDDGISI